MDILDFKSIIEKLVNNIAVQEYDKLEQHKQNGIIPITDLTNRIKEYGYNIIPLPSGWIKDALVYNIDDKRLDVYLALWTNSGKSDLTLSVSCFFVNNHPHVEINDLEVL